MSKERPKPGQTFRHYKGGAYVVISCGIDEKTEEDVVIYRSIENDGIWVRPLTSWNEEVDGKPRFTAEVVAQPIIYHVFLNGVPTGITLRGNDRKLKCGCLLNCDMLMHNAVDAVIKKKLFPKEHTWVNRYSVKCPSDGTEGAYGMECVKVLSTGIGFIWLETISTSDIPGEEET